MPSWPPLKIQLLSSSCESLVCRVLKLSGSGTASGLAAASGRAGGAGGEAGSEGSAGDGPGIRPAPGAAGDGEAGAGGAEPPPRIPAQRQNLFDPSPRTGSARHRDTMYIQTAPAA